MVLGVGSITHTRDMRELGTRFLDQPVFEIFLLPSHVWFISWVMISTLHIYIHIHRYIADKVTHLHVIFWSVLIFLGC